MSRLRRYLSLQKEAWRIAGGGKSDRTGCAECTYKHLTAAAEIFSHPWFSKLCAGFGQPATIFLRSFGRARILRAEAVSGYPDHAHLANGVLTSAEIDLIERGELRLAKRLREYRKTGDERQVVRDPLLLSDTADSCSLLLGHLCEAAEECPDRDPELLMTLCLLSSLASVDIAGSGLPPGYGDLILESAKLVKARYELDVGVGI